MHLQCSLDKLSFYTTYICFTGSQSQAGGSNAALRECPLCMNECTLDQFPILRNCPHLFCMDCLHTYTKLEIHEGRVNLKCPQCNELIHPNGETILTTVQNIHEICLEQNLEFSRCSAFQECSELRVIKKSKNSKVNVQIHLCSVVQKRPEFQECL